MGVEFRNMEWNEETLQRRREAMEKSREVGPFGLTAEDHRAMGSTPDERLVEHEGKAPYEFFTDEEILNVLELMEKATMDPTMPPQVAQSQSEDLKQAIMFLKGVGRLPESFRHYLSL